METPKQEKQSFFSTARLGWALVCFAGFLVLGLGAYYLTVGEFVSGELAGIYALLSMLGAAAVLLRLWRFAVPYYMGCVLAWVCGSYVGALKGDFAPTAGAISAAFLIAVFALFGAIFQYRALRKKLLKRREEKAAEKKAEEEKEAAAVLTAAATPEQPEKESAKDAGEL